MKKIFLIIITVLVVLLLASCDVSQDLEEFSDGMMSMMVENLQGIFRDPSLASDSADTESTSDTESIENQESPDIEDDGKDIENQDNPSLE